MNPDTTEHMLAEDESTLNKDTVQMERMNAQIEQLLAENAALRKAADLKQALTDDETTIEMGEKELERMIAQLPKKPAETPGHDAGAGVLTVTGATPDNVIVLVNANLEGAGGQVRFDAPLSYAEAEALEYQLRAARLARRK